MCHWRDPKHQLSVPQPRHQVLGQKRGGFPSKPGDPVMASVIWRERRKLSWPQLESWGVNLSLSITSDLQVWVCGNGQKFCHVLYLSGLGISCDSGYHWLCCISLCTKVQSLNLVWALPFLLKSRSRLSAVIVWQQARAWVRSHCCPNLRAHPLRWPRAVDHLPLAPLHLWGGTDDSIRAGSLMKTSLVRRDSLWGR